MDNPVVIEFTPLTPAHVPLLHGWLQLPHVREFWDDGDRTPEQVEVHYFEPGRDVLAFIIVLDQQPAGYLQTYPVLAADAYAAWGSETGETWGIDLFIGKESWRGQRQAVPIIRAFLTHLQRLRPKLRRVLIDPETHNERARHVYARAGFSEVATVRHDGKVLCLMQLELPT